MTTITAQHADTSSTSSEQALLEALRSNLDLLGELGGPLPGAHQAGGTPGPTLHRLSRGRLLPTRCGNVATGPGAAQGASPQHKEPGGRPAGGLPGECFVLPGEDGGGIQTRRHGGRAQHHRGAQPSLGGPGPQPQRRGHHQEAGNRRRRSWTSNCWTTWSSAGMACVSLKAQGLMFITDLHQFVTRLPTSTALHAAKTHSRATNAYHNIKGERKCLRPK